MLRHVLLHENTAAELNFCIEVCPYVGNGIAAIAGDVLHKDRIRRLHIGAVAFSIRWERPSDYAVLDFGKPVASDRGEQTSLVC